MENKQILYIDMDGVLADFEAELLKHHPEFHTLDEEDKGPTVDKVCQIDHPSIFAVLKPIPGAIQSVKSLMGLYDVYFLSTPMWDLPRSYTDKRVWLTRYFGTSCTKRLILTHRKDLQIGDYLIDDRTAHGAGEFKGEHIHFGTKEYPNWRSVMKKLTRIYDNEF